MIDNKIQASISCDESYFSTSLLKFPVSFVNHFIRSLYRCSLGFYHTQPVGAFHHINLYRPVSIIQSDNIFSGSSPNLNFSIKFQYVSKVLINLIHYRTLTAISQFKLGATSLPGIISKYLNLYTVSSALTFSRTEAKPRIFTGNGPIAIGLEIDLKRSLFRSQFIGGLRIRVEKFFNYRRFTRNRQHGA